jgi:hypothetical protein
MPKNKSKTKRTSVDFINVSWGGWCLPKSMEVKEDFSFNRILHYGL